ncbi:MAG: FKBP-type peptidyl-prolyl cis-trans isomerase [Salinivirgaceae bacterium]
MNKALTQIVLVSLVLFLFQCQSDNFTTHSSGLQYRFINKNKDNPQALVDDVLLLKMRVTDIDENLVEEVPPFRIILTKPSHAGGSVEDALALMHKNDSAIFLINANNYFIHTKQSALPEGINPDDNLVFYIKLIDIIPKAEYEKERKLAMLSDKREEERLLTLYLKEHKLTDEPTLSGLYFIELEKGVGPRPEPGKKVTVHYEGAFINDQVFDSSYKRNKPFTFRFGVGEVIQGWDEGLARMQVGGKYKLIIPSYLAYGEDSVGPIPAYSTLVFVIELLHVEQ